MLRAFAIYGVIYLFILFLSAIGEVASEKKSVTAVLADYRRLTFRSALIFVALVVAASALLTVGSACSVISKLFLEGWFK
jgi:hypothetical protein